MAAKRAMSLAEKMAHIGVATAPVLEKTLPQVAKALAAVGIAKPSLLYNMSMPAYVEHALKWDGGFLQDQGVLEVLSGVKKGRSPKEKRVVDEETTRDAVWWRDNINTSDNRPMTEAMFEVNKQRAMDYLNSRDALYVLDGWAGWDEKNRVKLRIVTPRAYHAMFMRNMLVRPTEKEMLEDFSEGVDFTIYNAGQFPANALSEGMTAPTSVNLNFKKGEFVILGSEYAGEMKKGCFTVMNYLMPERGIVSMHASANEGEAGDVSLFFGLSGTGKTTLSADPTRHLIGDDEHCWSDDGISNIEGGCYAKCINLDPAKEPDIWKAQRFGTLQENLIFDQHTRIVDYDSSELTENTRSSYPLEFIDNVKIPAVGGHAKNIIFLTCDAFGVLPPVAKLTPEQAMYHFISGYTAKVAGTEVGIVEPQATFSACFGAPFLVWHPSKYAHLLAERMRKHGAAAWLVNTGWSGGAYGVGERMDINISRSVIDGIHSGELLDAEYENFDVFNLQVPKSLTGVSSDALNPVNCWDDKSAFGETLKGLAKRFVDNFVQFEEGSSADILAAAPKF
jgi:phosphoenolpyruvate carboxykinase (ATP)